MRRIERQLIAAGCDPKAIDCRGANEVEIGIVDEDGRCDNPETEAAIEIALETLGWSGYRTGYCSMVISKGYEPCTLDYCDKAARCHY